MGGILQKQLIAQLEAYLETIPEEEKVNAINKFRQVLHQHSPFSDQPVDCVLWIKQENIIPNDYNPNTLAPPEKRLLYTSLRSNGFTQPVVALKLRSGKYTIVDGYHRYEITGSKSSPLKQLKGYIPVSCLTNAEGRNALIAATIRHNRARGRHQISAMSEIIRELVNLGWDNVRIGKELGMDADEVLRLKQINGLTEMFADRKFSQAWTVK